MRLTAGIAVLTCACLLTGCGASDSDQVRNKIDQFVTAAAGGHYKTICEQVLAPSLVARLAAAGVSCPQAMRIAFQNVKNPTISVGRVTVKGDHAQAVTLSAASNQQASLQTIRLVKTSEGWRLASLGAPLSAPS